MTEHLSDPGVIHIYSAPYGRCIECSIPLTDRESDEGNGTKCYDCRIGALESEIRKLKDSIHKMTGAIH